MKNNLLLPLAIIVAALILAFSFGSAKQGVAPQNQSTLTSIEKSKVIKVGYVGYPPYTIKDPKSGKLSGYSVDMAEYIAKQAGWRIDWVQSSVDTMVPDITVGKVDVMVDPIFRTIPRAENAAFTRPYSYFGYAGGLVKKGDTRFKTIQDLNNPNVTIAVRLGYTDQSYVEQNLPKAKLKAMKVDDMAQVYQDVLSGNSDIALSDIEQLKAYAKEHSDVVDTLFVNNPPASVPAGFLIRQGDFDFYNFLNTSIDYMETNKVLDQLDKKYKVTVPRILQ